MHTSSSPRTWGCFHRNLAAIAVVPVFPTHVGVFPARPPVPRRLHGLPHARGGVSMSVNNARIGILSSPRTWGCFRDIQRGGIRLTVFPTHVGVFPFTKASAVSGDGLPHARGGVSTRIVQTGTGYASSPRTWGCFAWTTRVSNPVCVFATHVGVFPPLLSTRWHSFCLHHVRGVFLVRGLPALAYWSLPYTCGT